MISLFWAPADSMNSVQEMRFEFPSNLIGHGKSTMVVVVVVVFLKKKKNRLTIAHVQMSLISFAFLFRGCQKGNSRGQVMGSWRRLHAG